MITKIKTTVFFSFLLLIGITSTANTIEVPNDYPTIQDAINAAVSGDTVLVAPGTYYENINYNGKNIIVASHFILNNDISYIETTIINGSQPVDPDFGSCVLFISGEDATAVLIGFTLTGGTGTVWEDEHWLGHYFIEGGGILIQYSAPTIRNNIIIDNNATNVPAGIVSAGGGAIRSGDSNPTIVNNLILRNHGRYGSGIVLNYSGAVIKNNILAYHSGGEDYGGGTIWCTGSGTDPKVIENNTIVNNVSTNGGAIRMGASTVTILNSIFWSNTINGDPQINGGAAVVSYSNVEGGFSGTGNIDEDPLFETSNYILSDLSPCIDSGNPDSIYYDPEDLDNPGYALFPAKGERHNDMGAYGGIDCMMLPEPILGINDNSLNKLGKIDFSIFPNPAKNEPISLNITNATFKSAALHIYNVGGILVHSDEFLISNNIQVINIEKLSFNKGIYFVQLKIDEQKVITKKLIII